MWRSTDCIAQKKGRSDFNETDGLFRVAEVEFLRLDSAFHLSHLCDSVLKRAISLISHAAFKGQRLLSQSSRGSGSHSEPFSLCPEEKARTMPIVSKTQAATYSRRHPEHTTCFTTISYDTPRKTPVLSDKSFSMNVIRRFCTFYKAWQM